MRRNFKEPNYIGTIKGNVKEVVFLFFHSSKVAAKSYTYSLSLSIYLHTSLGSTFARMRREPGASSMYVCMYVHVPHLLYANMYVHTCTHPYTCMCDVCFRLPPAKSKQSRPQRRRGSIWEASAPGLSSRAIPTITVASALSSSYVVASTSYGCVARVSKV